MKVLIKRPGVPWEETEIENTLEAMQQTVGGYIETVTLASDLVIVCDEDGRLKGKPYNTVVCGVGFVGTIFICGINGDDFTDCPFDRQKAVKYGLIKKQEEV